METWSALAYLVAAVCFIMALRGLSSPVSARAGLRFGVVGMGVATIAAYAHPADTVRFYEINPRVLELSTGENARFTYVKDCAGKVEVVMGDAGISLERELAANRPQEYDVLVIDAFSSDSIPVHLITQEAFDVYLKHLRDQDGIIAFHVSNRFLDLRPLVMGLAESRGMESAVFRRDRDENLDIASTWVLVGRPGRMLKNGLISAAVPRASLPPPARPWTDDWSNLLGALTAR